jgi:hypothetical protein
MSGFFQLCECRDTFGSIMERLDPRDVIGLRRVSRTFRDRATRYAASSCYGQMLLRLARKLLEDMLQSRHSVHVSDECISSGAFCRGIAAFVDIFVESLGPPALYRIAAGHRYWRWASYAFKFAGMEPPPNEAQAAVFARMRVGRYPFFAAPTQAEYEAHGAYMRVPLDMVLDYRCGSCPPRFDDWHEHLLMVHKRIEFDRLFRMFE